MPKTLQSSDGKVRVVSPTTTTKLAQRIRSTFEVLADLLPAGLNNNICVEILLCLYIAEENAEYLTATSLKLSCSISRELCGRWIDVLVIHGVVDRKADFVALSAKGYDLTMAALERIYAVQRDLDQ